MKIVSESLTMVSSAFAFVAALAWNEAIKKLIEEFMPKGQGVLSLFVYAAFITIIAVVMISRLGKLKEHLADRG